MTTRAYLKIYTNGTLTFNQTFQTLQQAMDKGIEKRPPTRGPIPKWNKTYDGNKHDGGYSLISGSLGEPVVMYVKPLILEQQDV